MARQIEAPPVGGFQSQVLAAGHGYWSGLAGGDVPRLDDFNPMALGRLTSNCIWLGVAWEPLNFRYRLIGETVLDHLFEDHTGRWFRDIPHQAPPSRIFQNLEWTVRERRAHYGDTPYIGPKKDFVATHELQLPFRDDDGEIARVLVIVDFLPKPIGGPDAT